MASFNRVILVGNLTHDPEVRYIPSGTAVTDITLAVNDRRKNANGDWVEETNFIDVTVWGRTAEVVGEYLSKGSSTLIEGRLKLDKWENAEGQKRSKLKVICERMQMLGGRSGESGGGGGGGGGGRRAPAAARPTSQYESEYSQPAPPRDDFDAPPPGGGGDSGGGSGGDSGGDDIPF